VHGFEQSGNFPQPDYYQIQKRRTGMTKNVGDADKTIRIILGAILFVIGIFVQMGTGWRIGLFAVAAIAFVTAFVGL
jgi:hypothetical protein